MKIYTRKTKNKRVIVFFENKIFTIQFKRLIEDGEIIDEQLNKNIPCIVKNLKNKIIVTTIYLSEESGVMLFLNLEHLIKNQNK